MKKIKITGLVIIGLILFCIVLWIYNKLTLNDRNCKTMNGLYKDFPLIHTLNPNNEKFSYNLRDYYIKTAYNSCSAGSFKNDFVNICALKDCIRQGARCLDFEIYSIDNKPVIAVSSQDNFNVKESYNSVTFSSAIEVIRDYAFSGSMCPNPGDPLILHFRIMSHNKSICNEMANVLFNTLESRLLGKKYSYENNGKNLGTIPLKKIMGKIIIVIDKTNPLFQGTDLDEYVNIASNSVFMRALRYHDVRYTPDMQELIEFNKKYMTIALPDLNDKTTNISSALAMKYGCQMVAMSFQNFDTNMEYYKEFFNSVGSAFVLKPENLRHIPVTIPVPPPPNPAYSYKERPIKSDYYSFTI
jgi:hypothetical protein